MIRYPYCIKISFLSIGYNLVWWINFVIRLKLRRLCLNARRLIPVSGRIKLRWEVVKQELPNSLTKCTHTTKNVVLIIPSWARIMYPLEGIPFYLLGLLCIGMGLFLISANSEFSWYNTLVTFGVSIAGGLILYLGWLVHMGTDGKDYDNSSGGGRRIFLDKPAA